MNNFVLALIVVLYHCVYCLQPADLSPLKELTSGYYAKRSLANIAGQPSFVNLPKNVTVVEHQEVTLTCTVSGLHEYKLAWVHEDSQSIISVGRQLHTHSKRLSLAADHRTNAITISPVLASDRGWYMCQINTDPMTSARSYLQVLVPPTLKDWSGPEIEAREGSPVQLVCQARAYPPPIVSWRRTDAEPIFKEKNASPVWVVEGAELEFPVVSRDHSATYTCHITNNRTPSVSRDTHLMITYPPMLWLEHELVGVRRDHDVTLSCVTDGNPRPRHTWLKNGTKVLSGQKYRSFEKVQGTSWEMLLTIRNTQLKDITKYSCIASNPIGQAEGTIRLYEIREQILMPGYERIEESSNRQKWEMEDTEKKILTTEFPSLPDSPTGIFIHGDRNRDTGKKGNRTIVLNDLTFILEPPSAAPKVGAFGEAQTAILWLWIWFYTF